VGLPEFQDPLNGLLSQCPQVMTGDRLPGNKAGETISPESLPPFIKRRVRNFKFTLGLCVRADQLGLFENNLLVT
jgi:hypothetical protein